MTKAPTAKEVAREWEHASRRFADLFTLPDHSSLLADIPGWQAEIVLDAWAKDVRDWLGSLIRNAEHIHAQVPSLDVPKRYPVVFWSKVFWATAHALSALLEDGIRRRDLPAHERYRLAWTTAPEIAIGCLNASTVLFFQERTDGADALSQLVLTVPALTVPALAGISQEDREDILGEVYADAIHDLPGAAPSGAEPKRNRALKKLNKAARTPAHRAAIQNLLKASTVLEFIRAINDLPDDQSSQQAAFDLWRPLPDQSCSLEAIAARIKRKIRKSSRGGHVSLDTPPINHDQLKLYDPPPSVEDEALANLEAQAQLARFHQLPAKTQAILILDAEGFSEPEIATRLHMTHAAVHQRITRSRRLLRSDQKTA